MKTLVTLSGMSCSGKTVLAEYASQKENNDFVKVITSTTRPARATERNGVDYHFMSTTEFREAIDKNALLESEMFGENYYGTTMAELERAFATGRLPFAVVEPNGANTIRTKGEGRGINVLNVFIDCPVNVSLERWYDRYISNVEKGDPQTDFFAKRIATTITFEPLWKKACDYQLVLPYGRNEQDSINQLLEIKCFAESKTWQNQTVNFKSRNENPTPTDLERVKNSIQSLLAAQHDKDSFVRLAQRIIDPKKEQGVGFCP